MYKIVIASNNQHKIKEISALIPEEIVLVSLNEIGCFDDIPEESDTLEGNALQKAEFVFNRYGLACFADDTGLEVDALDGKPGVFSARFSVDIAPYLSSENRAGANMEKLLLLMQNKENRKAAFRTVICFIDEKGTPYYFEGKINGTILKVQKGLAGFGYDPIFVPDGYIETFAEMSFEVKNQISHRALATYKFITYLKTQRF